MRFVVVIFLLTLHYKQLFAYSILGIFPHPATSHVNVFLSLMKGLAEKGHSVTVMSHFPRKHPLNNYKDINLNENTHTFMESIDIEKQFVSKRLSMYTNVVFLSSLADDSCENGLRSTAVQNFTKTNEQFDLIILEYFNSDCFLSLVHKFRAPIIGLTSGTLMPWSSIRFGNPSHTAYIPDINMDFSDRMSFFERLENTLVTLHDQYYYEYVRRRKDIEIATKYLGKEAANLEQFIMNSSLLLVNAHFSLNLPRPLVPNVVEVGGIHIQPLKPLPKNIEKWINESTDGVIYFSLGSMIRGHTFPKEKRDAFLRVFSRLPQRVLWKWENETMEGKPDNVMIQKWMPQLDILCHPNVKAFIAHGGLLGITEAVHCGVPVVVMPQFGDQHSNARAVEASGGGVILQLSEATEDKVYKAVKKVLSSDFRQKAKELSERFRDRPLPPLETAIYWVEYVARHRGAPHMRTAAVDMPFYKYYLIDVIAFILLIIGTVIYSLYYVVRLVLKIVLKQNQKVKVS